MPACHVIRKVYIRESDCLGWAVLLCLVVCLTMLASFFLPSHLSLKLSSFSSLIKTCTCHLSFFLIVCYAHVFPCTIMEYTVVDEKGSGAHTCIYSVYC